MPKQDNSGLWLIGGAALLWWLWKRQPQAGAVVTDGTGAPLAMTEPASITFAEPLIPPGRTYPVNYPDNFMPEPQIISEKGRPRYYGPAIKLNQGPTEY